jgi:TolA-binding protein
VGPSRAAPQQPAAPASLIDPQRRARSAAPADARARFEQAARLEVSDPERALEGYRGLAAGTGAWAETALYAEGRLLLERGDRAHAVPLLRGYLRNYPRGANAADVRSLLASLAEPSDPEPR